MGAGSPTSEMLHSSSGVVASDRHLLQSALAQSQYEQSGDRKARSPVLQIVCAVKAEVL